MSLGVLVLSRESVPSITHPSISDEGIEVTTAIVKKILQTVGMTEAMPGQPIDRQQWISLGLPGSDVALCISCDIVITNSARVTFQQLFE